MCLVCCHLLCYGKVNNNLFTTLQNIIRNGTGIKSRFQLYESVYNIGNICTMKTIFSTSIIYCIVILLLSRRAYWLRWARLQRSCDMYVFGLMRGWKSCNIKAICGLLSFKCRILIESRGYRANLFVCINTFIFRLLYFPFTFLF